MTIGEGFLALLGAMLVRPLGLDVVRRQARAETRNREIVMPTLAIPPREPAPKAREIATPARLERMAPMPAPARRIVLEHDEAARTFIEYMQEGGAAGVYTAEEIDEFWNIACEELGIELVPYQSLRAALQVIPKVYIGRKAMKVEYIDVRARTGRERATLYRIPAKAKAGARQPRQSTVNHSAGSPLPTDGHVADKMTGRAIATAPAMQEAA